MDNTLKEKFEALFTKAKAYFADEEGNQSFGEVTLADGTILSFEGDELAEGVAVFVGEAPAPEGTHALEDGRSIVVDANGVVSEIMEAEESNEEMNEDTPQAITKEDVSAMIKEALAPLEEIFEGIQTAFKEDTDSNKELLEKLDSLSEDFAKFKDEPSETKTPAPKKFAQTKSVSPLVQHLVDKRKNSK